MSDVKAQIEFFSIVEPYIKNELIQNMKSLKGHNGGINRYEHSISVAYKSFKICKKLGLDVNDAAIGGILHDVGIYNDINNKFEKAMDVIKHPKYSLHLANTSFDVNKRQANIIKSHMWPVCLFSIPKSFEALVVNAVDKYCATAEYLRLNDAVLMKTEPVIA